jgi:hypothetical protein
MKSIEMNSVDSKIHVLTFECKPMSESDLKKAKNEKKKSRMFFSALGENIFENLTSRNSHPHREYRKVVADILKKLGLDPSMKFHWDVFAGCATCACSPGFVLEGDFNHNIFVSYTTVVKVEEEQKVIELSASEEVSAEVEVEGLIISN